MADTALPTFHRTTQPSEWIVQWGPLVAPGSSVLDVACGSGRHSRWFAERGCQVTGVDRDPRALTQASPWAQTVQADLEAEPWPLRVGQPPVHRQFDAVVITHYLWRAALPDILASVRPGGWLIYETFAQGNERFGHPRRPDFLLNPGELLDACNGWFVAAYENRFLPSPDRMIQRIAAQRPLACN